ncbi:MAG: ATP synthase F1 subunit delta [Thermodesulfobacteriota bacterium]
MKEIIAKRYARALIQIGQEDGNYEGYGEQLRAFRDLMDASPELRAVMANPIYERQGKKALVGALSQKLGLSPVVSNFLLLLVDKRRIGFFREIVACYERLADEVAGRIRARVVSAVPLDEATVVEIKKQLESMTHMEVLVELQQDPELIGGVVTQIGDKLYDGSVRTQLMSIKENLMKG